MRDAFVAKLTELMGQDPKLMLLTADLGFGIFDEITERFPSQFLNVGVAEQNMVGIATGLGLEGRMVFCYSIANFTTLRCLEQIRNDACYHEVNVNMVASGGGFSYGPLGMSHHATEDLCIMRGLPGVTVVAPGTVWEMEQAVPGLIASPGVGYLRIDKSQADDAAGDGLPFAIGKARRHREGRHATLICTGGILLEGLQAANRLAGDGIECRVLSMHTLKPLDSEAVFAAAGETGGIITLEEHNIIGGLGGAVAEACLEAGVVPGFFRRIGLRDRYSSIVGSQPYLKAHYGMDAGAVVKTLREALAARGREPDGVAAAPAGAARSMPGKS